MIQFQNPKRLSWLLPKRGHIRNVKAYNLEEWVSSSSQEEAPYIDEHEDMDNLNNDSCDEFSHLDLPNDLKLKCTSEGTGHTIQIKLHPRYTCPYTCTLMNQNVKGIGNKTEDNLEQIIEIHIKQ